jgi:hypothetical protein
MWKTPQYLSKVFSRRQEVISQELEMELEDKDSR